MLQVDYLITNGKPEVDSILGWTKDGWMLVSVQKAYPFHPYAQENDYLTVFAKYDKFTSVNTNNGEITRDNVWYQGDPNNNFTLLSENHQNDEYSVLDDAVWAAWMGEDN